MPQRTHRHTTPGKAGAASEPRDEADAQAVKGDEAEKMAPESRLPSAIVIGVGDELLLGRTVDTNAAWLARRIAEMGLSLHRHLGVGDRVDDIAESLRWGVASGDVVLVTGGLGPTRDDRTREAAARAFDRPLERNAAVHDGLLERSRALGRPSPSAEYLDQARAPAGATIVENALGSAPGLILEVQGKVVVLLPGVPFEMKALFRDRIAPFLRERFATRLRPVHFRVIHSAGVGESVIAERIAAALPPESDPVSVAFLPRLGNVEIRLTARETGVAGEVERWLDRVESEVVHLLEPYRYEAASGDIVEALAKALDHAGMTLAVAESCTGGLVGTRLTDRSGASGYFAGGIIAYADEVKVRELAVEPGVLKRVGAVSEETARAMAQGVALRFGSDVGVAVTGVAGPGGGTEEKPVGTVWYAVSVRGQVASRGERFPGGRAEVRERSAEAVLAFLLRTLKHD